MFTPIAGGSKCFESFVEPILVGCNCVATNCVQVVVVIDCVRWPTPTQAIQRPVKPEDYTIGDLRVTDKPKQLNKCGQKFTNRYGEKYNL